MNLRERLIAARERAGLSQAELAARLKVSAGTVAGWETEGEHSHGMRHSRIREVAEVLGIDAAELVA